MAVFDALRERVFKVVNAVMGDAASWTPSGGGAVQTAQVLFNGPTEGFVVEVRTGRAQYSAGNAQAEVVEPFFEYKESDFAGLENSVNDGGTEIVTVLGNNYLVKQVVKKFDGFNNKAILEQQ